MTVYLGCHVAIEEESRAMHITVLAFWKNLVWIFFFRFPKEDGL
jgi:hypothetical protein